MYVLEEISRIVTNYTPFFLKFLPNLIEEPKSKANGPVTFLKRKVSNHFKFTSGTETTLINPQQKSIQIKEKYLMIINQDDPKINRKLIKEKFIYDEVPNTNRMKKQDFSNFKNQALTQNNFSCIKKLLCECKRKSIRKRKRFFLQKKKTFFAKIII